MNFIKFVPKFHTFLVAPLLLYVGLKNGNVNKNIFTVMFFLGLAAIGYHASKLLDTGFSNFGRPQVINLLHLLLVGYLFACVGYRKGNVPAFAYKLMLLAVPFILYQHASKALSV